MRRALCVGVDDYPFGPLAGCVNDAESMAAVLARHHDGSVNFTCRTLTAPVGGGANRVTRASLRQELEDLFKHPAEIALLHFSGHGTENNLGGFLVTQDTRRYDEGLAMGDVLKLANDSRTEEVVIFLDCCNSGNLGNLPTIDNGKAILREGISILTASRAGQPSVEVSGGGVFTSLVIAALNGGAAPILGGVTAPGVYAFVEAAFGAWDQRPLFKSHLSKLLPLRRCTPPIDIAVLRELPTLFPLPAEDLPLSPAFERTSADKDDAKADVFRKLQLLSRNYLVIPVGAEHMYDAAMASKACRLTASGCYYWRLAKSGRI
jgi:hypothetical protein